MKLQYVIIVGNPIDGLNLYGPFDSLDEAVDNADANWPNGDWWVSSIQPPWMTKGRSK